MLVRCVCSLWFFVLYGILSLRFWHFRLVALLVLIVSNFHLLSRVLLFVWRLPSPSSTHAEWALKTKVLPPSAQLFSLAVAIFLALCMSSWHFSCSHFSSFYTSSLIFQVVFFIFTFRRLLISVVLRFSFIFKGLLWLAWF